MNKIIATTLLFIVLALAFPLRAQDETISEVSITATIRTYVLNAPRPNAELVGILQASADTSAYGRDADGNWLRILDGWVLGEVFNTEGEVGALPDATHSFLAIAQSDASLYDGPSTRWFEEVGTVNESEQVLVIGRNEDSSWLQMPFGWLELGSLESLGDISRLPVTPSGVIITAKTRTFILKEPDLSAEFVDVFEAGEEAMAIGQAGDWLQITQGWVSAEAVEVSGSAVSLPLLSVGILGKIVGVDNVALRTEPGFFDNKTEVRLRLGADVRAIGRNKTHFWLQLPDGWINAAYVKLEGDINSLPITEGDSALTSTSTSVRRATPTPTPTLDPRAIRTLIARHTDDIRILDLATSASATTIEYDLKPWPFVPNESIANEVAFKIICAIRNGQPIPNALKFIGHTHFKSEVGRKFTGPSVEMHISANNANRIVCRGNDPSDINWRRLASRYKSYPIPRGASIDYD